MTDEKLLSPKEAASLMGVNVETVRRWVREDRVPYYRVGVTIRLRLADLRRVAGRDDATRHGATPDDTQD